MKKKDVSTINNSVYYELDENSDTISDSSKQVDASNEATKYTHIVDGINNLSVGVVSVELAVIGFGIIGQGINQGVMNGGTNVRSNFVTNILTNSSKILFYMNTFQLNTLQYKTLVIGPQDKSVKKTIGSYAHQVIVEILGGNISVGLIPQERTKIFGV